MLPSPFMIEVLIKGRRHSNYCVSIVSDSPNKTKNLFDGRLVTMSVDPLIKYQSQSNFLLHSLGCDLTYHITGELCLFPCRLICTHDSIHNY